MKTDPELQVGDIAITTGFYSANDGGGASYNLLSTPANIGQYPADEWSRISLAREGLYAEIIVSDEVSICQLGAFPVTKFQKWATGHEKNTHDDPNYRDCHDNLMAYLNLCRRQGHTYLLTCPPGHFFTSPAFLVIGEDHGVRIRGASPKEYGPHNATVFHAWEKGQEYIWTLSGSERICHKDYPYIQASGVNVSNISFSGLHGGGNYPENLYSPIAGIIAVGMCNSNFESLDFSFIGGSGMVLCNTQETVFGFVSVVGCGAFYKGHVMPCIWYAQMMGKDGFARTILERTDDVYCEYKSRRNCSANYYDYIDAEATGGSIIHADRGAVFTHSEICNIQWEGSFACFSNMKNLAYDFILADGNKDYSLDNNIHLDSHPNEKTIRCGAFSGWGHDVTIHSITHTWNPMGYAAWYDGTMYRIQKIAAIVLNKEDTDKYNNVHLIDYNYRQKFPVYWIEKPERGELHQRVFSLDTPLPPNADIIRCYDGTPTPNLNFAGHLSNDVFYPALAPNTYMSCHYDPEANAPAHLTAYSPHKNGFFIMNYRANKHYFARIKTSRITQETRPTKPQITIYVTYQEKGIEKNHTFRTGVSRHGEFCYIDLHFGNARIDDNSPVRIWMGDRGGATPIIWDCIKEMDTSPIYSDFAPFSDYNWNGRLWFDTRSNVLRKCVSVHEPACYQLNYSDNKKLQPGTLSISIENENLDIAISQKEVEETTDNESLTKLIAQKISAKKYATMIIRNAIIFVGKNKIDTKAQPTVVSNSIGCDVNIEILSPATEEDQWE